jgi:hypothetical protein
MCKQSLLQERLPGLSNLSHQVIRTTCRLDPILPLLSTNGRSRLSVRAARCISYFSVAGKQVLRICERRHTSIAEIRYGQ